ncbi:hypothetical protein BU24DRAFT_4287 [Aaosphaeria arxii CBS 175.79]|uniref:Uncharacterized protein n=1 Tax=Aaosphaeria arxii CBS 175.79 TaxID=1450172 RepID=A0A6A5Y744_9PLEO|nr:uncharacterized protein BU24DRAFT_4287 [Aaosphaeria arxii CBS 175.79]KAF2020620.1 hypothetical protein BU24DRAFT_4287 [Aaosphaeria arxii CBS 175.79]
MSHAPPTPGEEPEPTSPVIDYSPATVTYDERFENNLMHAILNPSDTPSRTSGSPPLIDPTTLPVALDSPLRTHRSPIPGVLLTHANGYHTGGPGPAASIVNDFAEKFIKENDIQDVGQLERVVEEKIKDLMEVATERMREREEAIRKNEEVEKELKNLEIQRDTERRVEEKFKIDRAKRRGDKMEED